jgi:hypothetical protein
MQPSAVFSKAQRLLLDVVLASPEKAVEAWEHWDALTDWQHCMIDQGSFRLLPLVYRRLAGIAPDIEAISTLKGLYRRSWFENVRLFKLTGPGLELLINAGHPLLLFKGFSLSLQYYQDKGARSMADVDVLVPEDEAYEALYLLEEAGWQSSGNAEYSARETLQRMHSVDLHHISGGKIDLHRYLFHYTLTPGIDTPVWMHAGEGEFNGLKVKTLCPADEFLHTCLHGLRFNKIPSIRWIADAATILREAGENIDWEYLAGEARRREISLQTSKALNLLANEFEMPIPPTVLVDLAGGPFSWFEAAEYKRFSTNPGWIPALIHRQPFFYFRRAGRPGGFSWWIGLVRYLFFILKPPPVGEIPHWLVHRWREKRKTISQNKEVNI